MDEVLKSEVVLVLLEKEDGVQFDEFSGLFHSVHGYQLTLSNYGYKSLKALLEDMKDVVEINNVNGRPLIQFRPTPVNVISPPENDISEFPCHAAPEPQLDKPKSQTQTSSSQEHSLNPENNYMKDNGLAKTKAPSKKVENMILETLAQYPAGIGAKLLRTSIMGNQNLDLELYSKELGYPDMLSMLKQVPGITFLTDSKKNVIKATGPHVKPIVKTKPPQNLVFYEDEMTTLLKQFPLGIRVAKFKEIIENAYKIDLDIWSQQLGHADILCMLNQNAGVKFVKQDVIAPCRVKSQPPKCKQVTFSSTTSISKFLKDYPSGIGIKKLIKHLNVKYHMDLDTYSRDMGYTDVLSMLQQTPNITVINSDVVIRSFYLECKTKSKADPDPISNCKRKNNNPIPNPSKRLAPLTKAKPAAKGSTKIVKGSKQAILDKAVDNQNSKLKTSGDPRSQIPAPTPATTKNNPTFQNSIYNASDNGAVNSATTGNVALSKPVQSNVSYASVCSNNLKRTPINPAVQNSPASFNVQKVPTPKVSNPIRTAEPKGELLTSSIRENIRTLLKSHSQGLSIFQLNKLYLLKFSQPLVSKGLSMKKLLKDLNDIAKITGVGVQLRVYPVTADPYPSRSTKKKSECDANERKVKSVSASISKHPPPFYDEPSHQKKLGKKHALDSQSINQTQQTQSACGKKEKVNKTDNLRLNVKPSAVSSPFNQTNSLAQPAAPQNTSDTEWPNLPQKYHILKKIKQSSVTAPPQLETKQNKKNYLKAKEPEAVRPQERIDYAATTDVPEPRNLHKINSSIHRGPQDTQPSYVALPTPQSDFKFVMANGGFSFVKEEAQADMDKVSKEKDVTSPPSMKLNVLAQNASGHSERDLRNNHITPNDESLSPGANSLSLSQWPHLERPLQSQSPNHIRQFPYLLPGMHQKMAVSHFVNAYDMYSPSNMATYQDGLNPPPNVSPIGDQSDQHSISAEEFTQTWQNDEQQSCCIL